VTSRSTARKQLAVLMGITLTLGACSDSAGPTNQTAAIELVVRVHLVQSDRLDALNVGLSDAEVTELMTSANGTWAQAGVTWSLISVLTSVLTGENLRSDIWNVFMIRDFGGRLGGV